MLESAKEELHEGVGVYDAGGGRLEDARLSANMGFTARGFLPGEGGAWVEGQRRLLRSVRLHALSYTVEAELQRGRAGVAEREAEQLLALDPLREGGYRLLMRALAAGGNGSGVHGVLAECRAVFAAEGMEPSAETIALAATLVRG